MVIVELYCNDKNIEPKSYIFLCEKLDPCLEENTSHPLHRSDKSGPKAKYHFCQVIALSEMSELYQRLRHIFMVYLPWMISI